MAMFQKSTEQALFAILICLEFSQVRIYHHKYLKDTSLSCICIFLLVFGLEEELWEL